MTIDTPSECDAAMKQIIDLSNRERSSEEETELARLIGSVNAFRLQSATFVNGHPLPRMTSIEQYELAKKRISELEDFPEGTPEAEEMAVLVADVMLWDKTHDKRTPSPR